jgi:hypothetical protein
MGAAGRLRHHPIDDAEAQQTLGGQNPATSL